MKTRKHFALGGLLVIAVAVVLGTPAPATADGHKTQVKLYPPADSPFPDADGQVSLSLYRPPLTYWLDGISVSKLAPNTSYYMPLYIYDFFRGQWFLGSIHFQTDTHGAYKASEGGILVSVLYPFEVYDLSTGTLVLSSSP